MADIAINISGLSKCYKIGEPLSLMAYFKKLCNNIYPTIPERSNLVRQQSNIIWALRDISFSVNYGEVVGIIGHNGAGKSTLLKLISRITTPTEGCAQVYGRLGSLLEVGTGFHPELTGRENIFLNGAILGMKRTEVMNNFDEIVAFSGVEKFIDTPVKRYSSGMYMRLAFSVAVHMRSEILVVDEVLAVGDAAFQNKCVSKMHDIAEQGRAVFFVSHNMTAIRSLCDRAVILDKGRLVYDGDTDSAIDKYYSSIKTKKIVNSIQYHTFDDKPAVILGAKIDESCMSHGDIELTQSIRIYIDIEVRQQIPLVYLGLGVRDMQENLIIFLRDFEVMPELINEREKGCYRYAMEVPGNLLTPGDYSLELVLARKMPLHDIHRPKERLQFTIIDTVTSRSLSGMPWHSTTAVIPSLEYKKL